MKKYYTFENYAKQNNVDRSTISKWAKQQKINTVEVISRLPKLVEEDITEGPNIISLMNLKGGCGKTTLAAHTAGMISKIGYKVLLVDTDLQNQCRLFYPEQEYEYTIKDVIEGSISIEKAIYNTNTKNSDMDIIFSHNKIPFMQWDSIPVELLGQKIETIKHRYDFIIIDTSPNFDKLARSVVMMSTNIIIPIIPDKLNIDGMQGYIEEVQALRPDTGNIISGIVFNLVKKKAQHEFYIEDFKKDYPNTIYDTIIPEYADISTVVNFNSIVFDYREKSKGSQVLKHFVWETLQRI